MQTSVASPVAAALRNRGWFADANGIRFVEGRHAQVSQMLVQGGDAFTQHPLTVAEIAAEGDGNGSHAQGYRLSISEVPEALKASVYQLYPRLRRLCVLPSAEALFEQRVDRRHEHQRHHRRRQ